MKHWNLGNTTVRNPDRIKQGLRVLKEYFEDKPFGEKEHLEFYERLLERGVIESGPNKLSRASKEISGRKWAACFNQLGFSIAWKTKGVVKITDAGNALLESDIEEEVFLRQFLKYHLPSPIEHGKEYTGFEVNPFYVILKILSDLNGEGFDGLTKDEISLYVITCIRNELVDMSERKIKEYRKKYTSIKGKVGKKKYYYQKKKELIHQLYRKEIEDRRNLINELSELFKKDKNVFFNEKGQDLLRKAIAGGKGSKTKKALDFKKIVIKTIKSNSFKETYEALLDIFVDTRGRTLSDYADTTVRYTVKTGLLSISGDKLIVKQDKILLVSKLLEAYPQVPVHKHLDYYYSSLEPYLPSDEVSFLQTNIQALQHKLVSLQERLKILAEELIDVTQEKNPLKLKKIQHDLEKKVQRFREKLFYREQARKQSIKDILDYYDKIMDRSLFGGEAYRPAYLEWTTWRLFLAINNIFNEISDTRNFDIDEELNPIHHAKSGLPDMVFEYADFVIVCEVTLRTSENQWSEEEPVPRHVAKVMEDYTDKKVFGVFIAPSIDHNTTIEFYRKKRMVKGRLKDVRIVPLTINQVKKILLKFEKTRFTTDDLKELLEEIIVLQDRTKDPLKWENKLNSKIERWVAT